MLAVVLGAIWHLKSHWSISLVVGAVTRLVGLLGYFYITAWMLKEDLFSLLLNNVYSLLVPDASHLLGRSQIACIHQVSMLLHVSVLPNQLQPSCWVSVACLHGLCYARCLHKPHLCSLIQTCCMNAQGSLLCALQLKSQSSGSRTLACMTPTCSEAPCTDDDDDRPMRGSSARAG